MMDLLEQVSLLEAVYLAVWGLHVIIPSGWVYLNSQQTSIIFLLFLQVLIRNVTLKLILKGDHKI